MNRATEPASLQVEKARGMMMTAYRQIQKETGLPAFIMEGAVMEVLAEIRRQKTLEIIADMRKQESEKGANEDEHENGD